MWSLDMWLGLIERFNLKMNLVMMVKKVEIVIGKLLLQQINILTLTTNHYFNPYNQSPF